MDKVQKHAWESSPKTVVSGEVKTTSYHVLVYICLHCLAGVLTQLLISVALSFILTPADSPFLLSIFDMWWEGVTIKYT